MMSKMSWKRSAPHPRYLKQAAQMRSTMSRLFNINNLTFRVVTVSAAAEETKSGAKSKRGLRAPVKLPKPKYLDKSRQVAMIDKDRSFDATQKSVKMPSGI